MAVYWLGLLTDAGAEPPASQGYARVRLVLPDAGPWTNPLPIVFCRALRRAWPTMTQAGVFTDASFGTAFIVAPLAPPPHTTPMPLEVDVGEEAVVPTGWLTFEFVAAGTPRPYGRHRYGRQAYSSWPDSAVMRFRVGARPLADKVPVVCAAWTPEPAWMGRQCA